MLLAGVLASGCSSGGGGSSNPPEAPVWGRFRRDILNSGQATGDISRNPGVIQFSVALPGGATASTPAIGLDDTIYVGTANGLLALDPDGENLRVFDGYTGGDCMSCTPPSEGCQPVGAINSSPALTTEGDIVVQTRDGRILAVVDDGEELTCRWVFEPEEVSSAEGQSSPLLLGESTDSPLGSVYVGTDSGYVLALNRDGSEKWRRAPSGLPGDPISSSLAMSLGNTIYVTTAEGNLYSLDVTGRLQWQFPLGAAWTAGGLVPSPAIDAAIYTVSNNGMVIAVNPDGTLKWRHQVNGHVNGSPAFIPQYVGMEPTATPTPESTPDDTPEVTNTPTPTETPLSVIDVVVYVVDETGTVYGIRDSTGLLEGKIELNAEGVGTSPVANAQVTSLTAVNPFVVFGGDDGYVYATALDGARPCTDSGESQWEALEAGGARVSLGSAVRSSPAVGIDGTIYVTTADGWLHAIGPPQDATAASCTTWTPTATATRTATPTATETPT